MKEIKAEWLLDYLVRSGDDEILEGEMEYNEHGFLVWNVRNNKFIVIQVYGDGNYWDKWVQSKAEELECKTIVSATKRNPEAFVKRFGVKIVGYIMEREV